MTLTLLGLILFTVTLSACAQLAFKLGVGNPAVTQAMREGALGALTAVATSPLILLGLAIYGLSVMLWLWVLTKVDLSIAYPFVGISFLVTMAFGAFLLNEDVTAIRIAGTVLIALGCILVGRSA